eukprot:TRINITY_DN1103_c0_g1_i1.p2 TRINITY_DN1103_c0_g1~~TRINITY_DN1103_c0_g1_i1.p2  ORF type:complete len:111 (-),score=10.58 TRINITY_DN1103_c0_g1_i1:162-494(-)
MNEAVNLFHEICTATWFENVPILLFLNKIDLLKKKLKRVQLSDWETDYKGDNSYGDACEYFRHIFETVNGVPMKRKIYTHFTCVIDDSVPDLLKVWQVLFYWKVILLENV